MNFRLQAFLSAVCEYDVQSFTFARWKDFLPQCEYKGQMSVKYKNKILYETIHSFIIQYLILAEIIRIWGT